MPQRDSNPRCQCSRRHGPATYPFKTTIRMRPTVHHPSDKITLNKIFIIVSLKLRTFPLNFQARIRARRPTFDFRQEKLWDFFSRHRTQTGSGANPASYPMSTWAPYPGAKAAGA